MLGWEDFQLEKPSYSKGFRGPSTQGPIQGPISKPRDSTSSTLKVPLSFSTTTKKHRVAEAKVTKDLSKNVFYQYSGLSHRRSPRPHMCTVPRYEGRSFPMIFQCRNISGVWFHSTSLTKRRIERSKVVG